MLIFHFVKKVIYNCLRHPNATASAIYRKFFQLFGGLTRLVIFPLSFVIVHLFAPLLPLLGFSEVSSGGTNDAQTQCDRSVT
ncbi:hypothetical protein [Coleofasciculus sp. F4-SAH-05]|uniref:hypothetical protein n=1 Tax=Coleofasciculus sp. F4-SAH-05 TaxID=3069525 RepID=UPI0032FB6242